MDMCVCVRAGARISQCLGLGGGGVGGGLHNTWILHFNLTCLLTIHPDEDVHV